MTSTTHRTRPEGGGAPVRDEMSERLAALLRRHEPEIDCAYLFGSVARGDGGPMSDVDLGILVAESTPAARRLDLAAAIAEEAERVTNTAVDVVILNDGPPALRHRVIRDGVVLFANDERCRVAFESRSIAEFLDFQPVLARHDRELLERAREGRLGT